MKKFLLRNSWKIISVNGLYLRFWVTGIPKTLSVRSFCHGNFSLQDISSPRQLVTRKFVAGLFVVAPPLTWKLCQSDTQSRGQTAMAESWVWSPRRGSCGTRPSGPRSEYISLKWVIKPLADFLKHDTDWGVVSWLTRRRKVSATKGLCDKKSRDEFFC